LTFDVSDYTEEGQCCDKVQVKKTLVLEEEEAVLTIIHPTDCCGNRVGGVEKEERRTPYAQLGSIMKHEGEAEECGNRAPIRAVHTDRMEIQPGFQGANGCCTCVQKESGLKYEPLIDQLIAELNQRKVARGNIGQMKAAEVAANRMEELYAKMDAIIAHLGITYKPPEPAKMER